VKEADTLIVYLHLLCNGTRLSYPHRSYMTLIRD